jgi:hypothetical protein
MCPVVDLCYVRVTEVNDGVLALLNYSLLLYTMYLLEPQATWERRLMCSVLLPSPTNYH